jgi:hypothetical protein
MDDVRQYLLSILNNRRGCLITGGLDTEDKHAGYVFAPRASLARLSVYGGRATPTSVTIAVTNS